MDRREIEQLGLQTVAAWRDQKKIQEYLAKKSQRYGLTVAYKAGNDIFRPADVKATNRAFVDYVRYWVTNGERGIEPNKRSGSYNRFRQYMEEKGYNINVPFDRRWSRRGVWHRVFVQLAKDADLEEVFIDSTIVRAHQHAAGAPKKSNQALGRSRGGLRVGFNHCLTRYSAISLPSPILQRRRQSSPCCR